jgi:hypothetical protein
VARYYFHLKVGRERYPDDLGIEFSNLETAYLDAFQAARDMWMELLNNREDPTTRSFEISVANDGRLLLTLPFKEVLEAARKPIPPLKPLTQASISSKRRRHFVRL